jgi:hypothetical protein
MYVTKFLKQKQMSKNAFLCTALLVLAFTAQADDIIDTGKNTGQLSNCLTTLGRPARRR